MRRGNEDGCRRRSEDTFCEAVKIYVGRGEINLNIQVNDRDHHNRSSFHPDTSLHTSIVMIYVVELYGEVNFKDLLRCMGSRVCSTT